MKAFTFTGFLPVETCSNDRVCLQLTRAADAEPDKNWVPACYFTICRANDKLPVGRCDLRLGYNSSIAWGGNIGYAIDAEYRGKGYAGAACELLFDLARKYGMPYVHIAVNTENFASQRVCEKLRGQRSESLTIPTDNDRYQAGERTTYLYRFDLI